jgi:hypothetical protein
MNVVCSLVACSFLSALEVLYFYPAPIRGCFSLLMPTLFNVHLLNALLLPGTDTRLLLLIHVHPCQRASTYALLLPGTDSRLLLLIHAHPRQRASAQLCPQVQWRLTTNRNTSSSLTWPPPTTQQVVLKMVSTPLTPSAKAPSPLLSGKRTARWRQVVVPAALLPNSYLLSHTNSSSNNRIIKHSYYTITLRHTKVPPNPLDTPLKKVQWCLLTPWSLANGNKLPPSPPTSSCAAYPPHKQQLRSIPPTQTSSCAAYPPHKLQLRHHTVLLTLTTNTSLHHHLPPLLPRCPPPTC